MDEKGQLHLQFACTANHGRSPVAEAVAWYYINEVLKGNIPINTLVSSTGTRAAEVMSQNFDYQGLLRLLEKGLHFNREAEGSLEKGRAEPIYSPAEAYQVQQILDKKGDLSSRDTKIYAIQAGIAMSQFEHEQRGFFVRNRVEDIGKYLKTGQDQTIADPSIDLLVGMAERNSKAAQKIWTEGGLNPEGIVTDMESYVGRACNDGWGSALPSTFEKMYNQLFEDVYKVVDAFFEQVA